MFEKRSPYPFPAPAPEADPGLVGDIVNGVGGVASNAVNGVVGLVTTALSDVHALVAPSKTSSTSPRATTTAPAATSSPNTPAAATSPAPPDSTTPASSSGNSGGSSGEGESSGGSESSGNSGSSDGDGSAGNNDGPADNGGSTTDGGSGSSVNGALSGSSSPASVVSFVNGGGSTATLQSGPGVSSSSGVLNVVSSGAAPSGSLATASPVINAVGSTDSDKSNSPSASSASSSVQGPTNVRGTGTPSSTGSSDPGSGSDGGADGNGASTNNSHGLSAGVIAAIVVASSLALLVFIVFIMRKWYRRRRARRFENWASRPGVSTFFGGAASANVIKQMDEKSAGRSGSGSGRRSVRSSFGTTYDLGHSPDPFAEPSASNFSEFYTTPNASHLALTPSPQPSIVTPMIQRPENAVGRQSPISVASSSSYSNGSASGSGQGGNAIGNANASSAAVEEARGSSNDGHAQYLIVPVSHGHQDSPNRTQLSPISVRPWSPTERWAFPKPPTLTSTATSSQKTIFYEQPTSPIVSESAHIEHVPATNLPSLSPLVPAAAQQHDPFVDPSHAENEARASSAASVASEGAATAQTSASHTEGVSGVVEYIRRPFVPTLADELRVYRGDVIRVLQAFDDGWVQIEKLSSAVDTVAAATTSSSKTPPGHERGLIPVDCLREAGEPLPFFLASRRVSSYYGGGVAL